MSWAILLSSTCTYLQKKKIVCDVRLYCSHNEVRLNPFGFSNSPYYRRERFTLINRCWHKVPDDAFVYGWQCLTECPRVTVSATLILRNFDMNFMPVGIVRFFPSLLDRSAPSQRSVSVASYAACRGGVAVDDGS